MKEILEQLRKILNEDNTENLAKDTTIDERSIRELLSMEYEAVKTYEELSLKAIDERTKAVFLDISREERVHIKELESLLRFVGVSDDSLEQEGRKEVVDLIKDIGKGLKEGFLTRADLEAITQEQINDMYRDVISKRNNRIIELENYLKEEEHVKNVAYSERDMLVALISKVFPSYLTKHDPNYEDWDREWMNICVIDMPTGQCSWHTKDNELPLFSHLKYKENNWDGHTTIEKYIRLVNYNGGSSSSERELSSILCENFNYEDSSTLDMIIKNLEYSIDSIGNNINLNKYDILKIVLPYIQKLKCFIDERE